MNKLSKCPKCSCPSNSAEYPHPNTRNRTEWIIVCEYCGAAIFGSTKQKAIENWNAGGVWTDPRDEQSDTLNKQGKLLWQMVGELKDEVLKLKAAETEIERRGKCMERLYEASGLTIPEFYEEASWFDSDGKVLPYSPDGTES